MHAQTHVRGDRNEITYTKCTRYILYDTYRDLKTHIHAQAGDRYDITNGHTDLQTNTNYNIQTYKQMHRCIHTNKDRQSHKNYVRVHEQHRWGKLSESTRPHTSKNIRTQKCSHK